MKKLHTLPLAAALLLASPALLASNFPLMPAVHAAAQQDTIKESTLPAKAAGDKDEERSLEAPVPWLLVEDHRIEVYDAGGKRIVYSSRPIVRVKGSAHASLACGLDTWNRQEAQDAKRGFNFAYDFKKEDRENGVPREAAYFDYSVITKWGRVDEHMVSFCNFGMSYAGGVHPMHGKGGMTFDAKTGKEVGLAAIVHQGDTERGDVEHAAFDGGADGSGVVYAEGLVAAVVDARDEQVGLAVEHFADGQLHAVGRCARATADGHALRFGEHPVGDGLCGGDGGRHARAGPIGGHDKDVAQQAHAFGQRTDTARIDAVVVRYQYQGSLIHLFCHSFN